MTMSKKLCCDPWGVQVDNLRRDGVDADVQPLFPFGYGRSYGGPFEYSGL